MKRIQVKSGLKTMVLFWVMFLVGFGGLLGDFGIAFEDHIVLVFFEFLPGIL